MCNYDSEEISKAEELKFRIKSKKNNNYKPPSFVESNSDKPTLFSKLLFRVSLILQILIISVYTSLNLSPSVHLIINTVTFLLTDLHYSNFGHTLKAHTATFELSKLNQQSLPHPLPQPVKVLNLSKIWRGRITSFWRTFIRGP